MKGGTPSNNFVYQRCLPASFSPSCYSCWCMRAASVLAMIVVQSLVQSSPFAVVLFLLDFLHYLLLLFVVVAAAVRLAHGCCRCCVRVLVGGGGCGAVVEPGRVVLQ